MVARAAAGCLLVSLALGLAACGGSTETVTVVAQTAPADTAPATATAPATTEDPAAAEFEWLTAFDEMTDDVNVGVDGLKAMDANALHEGEPAEFANVVAAVETVISCERRLDDLGPPPTAATEELANLYRKGCVRLASGAQGLSDAIDAYQAAGTWDEAAVRLLERGGEDISRAVPFITAAYEKLAELLAG